MDFVDAKDRDEWKLRCAKQRNIARNNPCYDPGMLTCEDFETSLGPYHLRLWRATFLKPAIWNGSVSLMKDLGSETVYDKETGQPIFDAPREGLVKVDSWTAEEYQTARDLLGDLFGPLIQFKDQQVKETKGIMVLSWSISDESARRAIAVVN